jgi:type II secretory pathway component PulF
MQFHWPALDASQRLSAEESAELAARVAELTRAGLPLGEGLRALADELTGWRLRHAVLGLADRLDAGMDLAEAIAPEKGTGTFCRNGPSGAAHKRCLSPFPALPPHLRGLMLAGLRSGQLAEVLEEYVDLQQSQAELRRRAVRSLCYPIILLTLLAVFAILTDNFVIGYFVQVFRDFGTKLPDITILFIHCSGPAAAGMLVLLGAVLAIPVALTVAPGVRWIWPILRAMPMLGPLLRWSHLAQFSRLMGLLLEQRVPLPDALRLCSEGLRDADLAHGCRRVAGEVDEGRVLYESMAAQPQFPPSLIPIVEWGQRAPALAEAFRAAAEMFEGRLRSQGTFLEAILLPIMFLLVISFIGAFVIAMMLPMISLITALSGGL